MPECAIDLMHFNAPPPEMPRSLSERITAGNKAWRELIAQHETDGQRTPMSGALLLVHFSRFVHEFFHDHQLRERLIQDFEAQLRDEGPKQQGSLL